MCVFDRGLMVPPEDFYQHINPYQDQAGIYHIQFEITANPHLLLALFGTGSSSIKVQFSLQVA